MIVLIPAALIAKQPDLGTALTLLMAGAAMFWLAGVRWWKFALIGIVVIGAIPAVWYSGKLHDYQKNRILTFLDPERDPLGTSYNIIQSKIAIGSGGFSGKGFLHGSQSQLSFLPEHQTDFIFTMYAEETGFGGAVFLLLLYGLMLAYGWMIGHRTRSYFSRLMAMGMSTLFFLHIFINIAMVMGMIPAVGAPLPLLSYGGTIMMATLVMFGFLMNAHVHHLSNL
jgi:rod shape determining protein RodA